MTKYSKYGDISPRTAGYAVRDLLARGTSQMTVTRFGTGPPTWEDVFGSTFNPFSEAHHETEDE